MPSVWGLLPFSSKKKGHHGSKFKDFQSYDAQRFPPYSNITQNLTHPQYYQQQQPQQNHVVQHTNPHHNQYQHVTSPPIAFSPRHQHQSQFQQQNTLVQSPQLISSPAITNLINQCHCQHCTSPNQVGYGHNNHLANLGQVMSPPQTIISPPVASPPVQMMNSLAPQQPQSTLPVQSMVPPHQPPHMQHQHSMPLMHHDHQMLQQQCMQTPHPHHQQPHQQHQQIGSPVNEIANQYANQIPDYTVQQGTVQCTCHHCPSHQPPRQIVSMTQQYHQFQIPTHMNDPLQQQLSQNNINLIHTNQPMDMNHTNNTCQHQIIGAQLPHNQMIQQPCGTQFSNNTKSKLCTSQEQNQNTSILMSSSTPRIQHQELNSQQQHHQGQCQQQYSNTDAVPQFHYHTIQPNQYQQQKQQLEQQQQHHQRIQSLHHQVSRSPNHLNENQIAHVIESATRSYPQVDSRVHEFSRYANVRSIMSEHVYCNQKPELILPEYESPPSYDTFIANKDTYIIGLRNHHMTHHSESLVSQKTKDSSYENLRRFSPYGNFDGNRQEPGLTT